VTQDPAVSWMAGNPFWLLAIWLGYSSLIEPSTPTAASPLMPANIQRS